MYFISPLLVKQIPTVKGYVATRLFGFVFFKLTDNPPIML